VIGLASIKDVAIAAGVSTSTVSRIINENPAISAETREKVLKVMKDLDYVPNSMARALSNQRAFTVTLAINADDVKSFNNPFFYEVMHGIEKVVYQKDLCLIIANMQTVIKKENILTWLINGKRTQGIILPSSLATEKNIKELNKHHFPFVVFGEPDSPDPLNWVDVNNRQGGQQAVEHLVRQGYRKIA
jgi:DNA-binding LacI/PurR family transcriptional regulator